MKQVYEYEENVTYHRVHSESQDETADSCFDMIGSRQHGVTAQNGATSTKNNCLLKVHGNDL